MLAEQLCCVLLHVNMLQNAVEDDLVTAEYLLIPSSGYGQQTSAAAVAAECHPYCDTHYS